jgi:hypothetical protein
MPTTAMYRDLLKPEGTRTEMADEAQNAQLVMLIRSLGVLLPGTALSEDQLKDNTWNLGDGDYGGFEVMRDGSRIHGITSGALFTKPCSFGGTAIAHGVWFSGGAGEGASVRLVSGSRIVFNGCKFSRVDDIGPHIKVDAGCKASFIGCVFVGIGYGQVFENEAGATDVQLIGCHNATGFGMGTVTETGSI